MPDLISIDTMTGDCLIAGERASSGSHPVQYRATLHLLVIRNAWDAGVDMEDLADGFGPGVGTMGDWSGIRDSTPPAKTLMLERALNAMTFTPTNERSSA